jgi:hypothetical protein
MVNQASKAAPIPEIIRKFGAIHRNPLQFSESCGGVMADPSLPPFQVESTIG